MNEPVAILGTGVMSRALSARLARAGFPVALGSRSAERAEAVAAELRAVVPGAAIQSGSYAQVVRQSAIIIPALGFGDMLALLPALADDLAGRTLVDLSTPWDEEIADASAAERLAALLPATARLVGAWKSTFAGTLAALDHAGMLHDVLLCGDDVAAKQQIAALIAATGCRAVDCGALSQARVIEAMVRMMGTAARNLGVPAGTPLAWKFLP